MLNVRGTLWSFLGIFFLFSIISAAFAQQNQQSGSTLSESQFMQIIDRIDKVEDNMRDHVDKKIGELDKKIDVNYKELNTKFYELDKKVAVLRSDVDKLFTIIIAIAVAVGAHLLIFIGSHIYSYWRDKTDVVPKVIPENRDESDENLMQRHLRVSESSKSKIA